MFRDCDFDCVFSVGLGDGLRTSERILRYDLFACLFSYLLPNLFIIILTWDCGELVVKAKMPERRQVIVIHLEPAMPCSGRINQDHRWLNRVFGFDKTTVIARVPAPVG